MEGREISRREGTEREKKGVQGKGRKGRKVKKCNGRE